MIVRVMLSDGAIDQMEHGKSQRMKRPEPHILPAGFIHKCIIKDNQDFTDFNYENYLREFLNASAWFMKRTGGEAFRKPASESHGEYDAYTGRYSIDFKRILGESATKAVKFTSPQIIRSPDGTVYTIRPAYGRHYDTVRMDVLLRDYTLEELEALGRQQRPGIRNQPNRDVWAYLHLLGRQKNLLLYYPVVFFRQSGDSAGEIQTIVDTLYEDFSSSLNYRMLAAARYETYLSVFYENRLLILQSSAGGLDCVDQIPVKKSPTFCEILDCYDQLDYFDRRA
jgi:hypothetical protein